METVDDLYVEKLASAIDFMIENDVFADNTKLAACDCGKCKECKAAEKKKGGKKEEKDSKEDDKEDDKEEGGEPTDRAAAFKAMLMGKKASAQASSGLADLLRSKLQTKLASKEATEHKNNLSVIGDILARLRPEQDEVKESSDSTEPEEQTEEFYEDPEGSEEEKISADGEATLASMLEEADGGDTDTADENVSSGVKTAASQDVSLSTFLRESLLRKLGQAEV